MDFSTLAAGVTATGRGLAEVNDALGVELPTNTWGWHDQPTRLERVRYSTVPLARCFALIKACLESTSGLAHEWVALSPLSQADFASLQELDVLVCAENHAQLFASLAAPRLETVRIAGVPASRGGSPS